jgi:phage gpG-like protein
MSTDPAEFFKKEVESKIKRFIEKAPAIAGRYAVGHFQDNIRKRGGVPVNGNLERFTPRKYTTREDHGRRLLIKSGNMVDSIRITATGRNWVTVGISQRDIARYGNLHNEGGTITVTEKMKKFFWAKFIQSGGKTAGQTKTGKAGKSMKAIQLKGDAGFWKAMALKKTGSRIKIPKREFIRITPDLETGIVREFRSTWLQMFNQ